ncbi:MAG: hypothetical protein HKN36_01200 [Hellea sp.]|nr:hypothetical protein [Hellea sp.]
MHKLSIGLLAISALALTACSGNGQEKAFTEGCHNVFLDDVGDAAETTEFCGCLYVKFESTLEKDELHKITKLFKDSATERDFMDDGEAMFGEDRFREFGDIADKCEPD